MFTGISFAYFSGKRKEEGVKRGLNAEGAEAGAQRSLRRGRVHTEDTEDAQRAQRRGIAPVGS